MALELREQRNRPPYISGDDCECINRDKTRHLRVVGRQVLVPMSGPSDGPPRSVPVIADGHGNEKSGIRRSRSPRATPLMTTRSSNGPRGLARSVTSVVVMLLNSTMNALCGVFCDGLGMSVHIYVDMS
jgi:hypothetical protein